MMSKKVIIAGYGGHSYVAIDCLHSSDRNVFGYCDIKQTENNPYHLVYMGTEEQLSTSQISEFDYFLAIGNNYIRSRVFSNLHSFSATFVSAIHSTAIVSPTVKIGLSVMIAPGSIINAMAKLSDGVIVNTNASVDHECKIGSFSHIGPGATLCGNVEIGENSFIGAGSVVKEGITIGHNTIIGAGAVVVKNIPDNVVFIGNPAKQLK
jgi:sugar O-acyltransferase (sialic acid O-acetyltransferase NeuD family)